MSTTKPNTNHRTHTRLWLALRLHDLPLNALEFYEQEDAALKKTAPSLVSQQLVSQPQQAIVITEKHRVICANRAAQAAGVVYGMDITSAQLLSQCEVYPRAPQREQQALAQLAEQLYQFTPYIDCYTCKFTPDAGLLLELSRCLQLFRGIVALSERILTSLQDTLFGVSYGLAHTAKGAWLLSYQPHAITGEENNALFCARLKSLPIDYLYDFPDVVEALHKTGFVTLGDIAQQINAQSISSIKKRFGADFAELLHDVFAISHNFQQPSLFDKPQVVYQPTDLFCATVQFDYPVDQTEQLHLPIENLLQKLALYLRKRQLECQSIVWQLYDIYHNRDSISVRCDNPQSDWRLLYDLTLIQLAQHQLPFEVDRLELHCPQPNPIQNRNQNLAFDRRRQGQSYTQGFAITAAKLKARLGENAVYKLSYRDSYIPEESNLRIALKDSSQQQLPDTHRSALRPAWLLETPVPLENRSQGLYWRGQLTLIAGPERIQGNWWYNSTARDYFVAQRHDHLRLWVFLDLYKNTWYLQGIFA